MRVGRNEGRCAAAERTRQTLKLNLLSNLGSPTKMSRSDGIGPLPGPPKKSLSAAPAFYNPGRRAPRQQTSAAAHS